MNSCGAQGATESGILEEVCQILIACGAVFLLVQKEICMSGERVFVYQVGVALWLARNTATGFSVAAESREAAIANFKRLWGGRAGFTFVDGPPPPPRPRFRTDEAEKPTPEQEPAAEPQLDHPFAHVFAEELKRFHPDHNPPGTSWSCDEVVAALLRLREAHRDA